MRKRLFRDVLQGVSVEGEQSDAEIAAECGFREGGQQIEANVEDAQLFQQVDGTDWEFGQEIVEQTERGEGLADALEGSFSQRLDEIAFEVEGGQRVHAFERVDSTGTGKFSNSVLGEIQEGEAF